jgi:DNA-binding Xre family transcriptional regulator
MEIITRSFEILNLSPERLDIMTELGLYLTKKSINKAEVSRKTGLSAARLSELTLNKSTKLRADELYLIALAIDVDPCDLLKTLFKDLKLPE